MGLVQLVVKARVRWSLVVGSQWCTAYGFPITQRPALLLLDWVEIRSGVWATTRDSLQQVRVITRKVLNALCHSYLKHSMAAALQSAPVHISLWSRVEAAPEPRRI